MDASVKLAGVHSAGLEHDRFSQAANCAARRNRPVLYCAKSDRFQKFGVHIWDEILPVLGVDHAMLKSCPNPISLQLRAACNDNGSPKKVVGLV
jgi:hypothetical protein